MIRIALFCCCLMALSVSHAQPCKKKYADQLEAGSKLTDCGANYTIEVTKDGHYILKRYYPDTKAKTHLVTYKDGQFKVKEGPFKQWWDDGTLVTSGTYENNLKEGEWLENVNQLGAYSHDQKEGLWRTYNADTVVIQKTNYVDGKRHGKAVKLDSLGQVIAAWTYNNGELVTTDLQEDKNEVEEMPRFLGCEDKNLPEEALYKCAQKELLTYIYTTIKYPALARELDIQGKAVIEFVIDTDGSITDIKVLNGVSSDITNEVVNVIKGMPKWRPGMQDGKPIKVSYKLPVNFKLK